MSTFSATGYIVRQVTAGPSIVPASGGSGDMLQSVYDSDGDGVVNDSQRLAGQLASYYVTTAQLLSIDTSPSSGPRNISIGAADADLITIGHSGSQVLLIGEVTIQDVNNVAVANKLADLNVNGPANSGNGVGFTVIENSIATGWMTTTADRNGWLLKAPLTNQATILLDSMTQPRVFSFPNLSGEFAMKSQVDSAKAEAVNEAKAYFDSAVLKKIISADFPFTSSNAAQVTDLNISIDANSIYHVRLFAHVGCVSTGGVKVAINLPAGTTSWQVGNAPSTATTAFFNQLNTDTGLPGTATNRFITTHGVVVIEGTVLTTTAGTLTVVVGAGVNGQQCYLYRLGTAFRVEKY